jgi:hypothetical protein
MSTDSYNSLMSSLSNATQPHVQSLAAPFPCQVEFDLREGQLKPG